jgi:hypothetical protein
MSHFNPSAPDHDTLVVGDKLIASYWGLKTCTHTFRYRQTPVPYVHAYSGGRYYRQPKTYRTIREILAPSEDNTPRVRTKVNDAPSHWEDCQIRYQRTWKRHRNTQWK